MRQADGLDDDLGVTRAWLVLEVRRRRRSLAVLALLVTVASGVVLASVAGALRGESAMPRLAAGSAVTTALVSPNAPGFDWDRVRALPQVEAVGPIVLGQNIPIAELPEAPIEYVPADDALGRRVERPAVLEGRVPDPDRADEAMVQPEFVERYHLGVGDTITALLWTPAQVAASDRGEDPGAPAGPRLPIRIVGLVRSVMGGLLDVDRPQLYSSPALYRQYGAHFVVKDSTIVNAVVRLRAGSADLPTFRADLARVSGRTDINVRDVPELMDRAQHSFTFQARCLLAFAAAAFLASLVLVGQAIARFAAAGVEDLQPLRAAGLTPRQTVLGAAAGPALAGVGGAVAGVAAAGAASRWFPIGSAVRMEPAPGFDIDLLVLGAGGLAVAALVAGAAVASAAWALRAREGAAARARPSAAAAVAARMGLPVPILVGTRFALEPGSGRSGMPVRPALVGAVAGVLGVLGAFTFSAGVADAAARPERFGQTWSLVLPTGWDGDESVPGQRGLLSTAANDPDVRGIQDARIGVAQSADGGVSMSLFTDDPVGRPVPLVVRSGRRVAADAEIVLGPTSADRLGARVGSRLELTGAEGRRRALTVVGIGFVPVGPHNDYDAGGWVSAATFESLFGNTFVLRAALIAVRPGADVPAVAARLQSLVAAAAPGSEVSPEQPPSVVAELRQVSVLPLALGYFLVVLALGAVGHALATTVRRRRIDVVVLRALGMTRWQSRGVVATQASVLAVVGLVFGVPLGLALGRTVWQVVADYTPLEYVPPLAVVALVLVAPGALLVANLLAAWPGHQAARMRIGHVLRTE